MLSIFFTKCKIIVPCCLPRLLSCVIRKLNSVFNLQEIFSIMPAVQLVLFYRSFFLCSIVAYEIGQIRSWHLFPVYNLSDAKNFLFFQKVVGRTVHFLQQDTNLIQTNGELKNWKTKFMIKMKIEIKTLFMHQLEHPEQHQQLRYLLLYPRQPPLRYSRQNNKNWSPKRRRETRKIRKEKSSQFWVMGPPWAFQAAAISISNTFYILKFPDFRWAVTMQVKA